VIEATRAAYDLIRRSERKVADLVLADPRRRLDATLAQAAKLADVSQPTVVRFCIAIGCSGFQELKLRLAHSLALGTPAAVGCRVCPRTDSWRGERDKPTNSTTHWKFDIILDALYPSSREKTFAAESKRLRSAGHSLLAIANKLGLSKSAVWRMLKTPDK
jgi:DNA-binding MurR/RpiR family transcriptional regulator